MQIEVVIKLDLLDFEFGIQNFSSQKRNSNSRLLRASARDSLFRTRAPEHNEGTCPMPAFLNSRSVLPMLQTRHPQKTPILCERSPSMSCSRYMFLAMSTRRSIVTPVTWRPTLKSKV